MKTREGEPPSGPRQTPLGVEVLAEVAERPVARLRHDVWRRGRRADVFRIFAARMETTAAGRGHEARRAAPDRLNPLLLSPHARGGAEPPLPVRGQRL